MFMSCKKLAFPSGKRRLLVWTHKRSEIGIAIMFPRGNPHGLSRVGNFRVTLYFRQ